MPAQKTQYRILVESELNHALWRIKEAAEKLNELIAAYQEANDRDMTEVEIAELDLDDGGWLSRWADSSVHDVMGFRWPLEMFRGIIAPLGERPADLDMDEPTPVRKRRPRATGVASAGG